MIALKKIVSQLDDTLYKDIESTLVKNKSKNSLFLLNAYRKGNIEDEEILEQLNINPNSFYVLKSRLNEKIQAQLTGNADFSKDDIFVQLQQIDEKCYNSPHEISMTFLTKLEKDLLENDMHNELLTVYSALKKITLFSDQYFHYSQQYNKQVALSISLEKSMEILGSFNRFLTQYDFSRSNEILERLFFLRQEMIDQYIFNPSKQIELIKNILEIQITLFCYSEKTKEFDARELLTRCETIIDELPNATEQKKWSLAINYLFFEYYRKINETRSALKYYEIVNASFSKLLLFSHICITSFFYVSKIFFLQELKRQEELNVDEIDFEETENTHARVLHDIHLSVIKYHNGNIKEGISLLNNLINNLSLKDYVHISFQIKLTLAFYYLRSKEYEMAENILKSISRKIKAEELTNYSHVLNLIKLFTLDMNNKKDAESINAKRDQLALFTIHNNKGNELLKHLRFELNNLYNITK